MLERCHRICGRLDACFINNKKQIECLSDLLINKAFCTVEILEGILRENKDANLALKLRNALRGPYEIINWTKYIQIAHDLKFLLKTESLHLPERRKEIRYPLPEIIQKYIELTVDAYGKMINGYLTNISQQGLQFVVNEPLPPGEEYLIRLSSRRLVKDLVMKIKIAYCNKDDERFITGAYIIEMPDDSSFNFFKYVLDLLHFV